MIRRPPRSTQSRSSAASDVYKRQGKVRAVGVSNFSAKQMAQAAAALRDEGLTLASNQVRINLLDRRVESNGVLAAAQGLGVTLIAYSPLAQGVLTGRYHDDPALVRALPWGRPVSYTHLRAHGLGMISYAVFCL